MLRALASIVVLLPLSVVALAPPGPWDKFNFAPTSKVVFPSAIHGVDGNVNNAGRIVGGSGSATLMGSSAFTLDFGVEVGGLISINFEQISSSSSLALSFTESPLFIRRNASDDSSFPSANTTFDGVLRVTSPRRGIWQQPAATLRGGFRYLTIVNNDDDDLTISNVTCSISFMPHVENLRSYSGYFFASDPVFKDKDFLTKVWYAGAYTIQSNTVPLNTGRKVPFAPAGTWFNNATLGVSGPIIVDGAKRDRAVWPGDMGVAVPSQFVSTNDLIPTRNALSTMFAAINPTTGALPESGPPLSQQGSDTYHAWTLIGTHNYFLYSGDVEWLRTIWSNYTKAVAFLEGKVDGQIGLMNVTGLRDWARLGGGGINAAGNALLYRVLVTTSELASHLNERSLSTAYAANATSIKTRFNDVFWLPSAGMYKDNQTTSLCPQDANSFAVIFNVTNAPEQDKSISQGLTKNWNSLGSIAPELPNTISPFIGGFELQAHFIAGNDGLAMDLLRREWGYMLYTNLSVQSTLLEGYNSDGSIGYRGDRGYNSDPAYVSHAHGWSAGPTSALTFYVLGLTVTSPQGATWEVAPHLSGLNAAEGQFETPLGAYLASWRTVNEGGKVFEIDLETPLGTSGVFRSPIVGGALLVDGKETPFNGDHIQLSGGKHTIQVLEE
ncbi:Six-hairpin glycosidase [Pleurotus eryngii]|uniref:Six-hairpin glycosidase n=1 Tax=Pleurotus eryngii TaxID=5323 RepID=A0A9P5ZR83_PLEER|nr:Six-hairpin glycosidase [Pleurotus eryngii]